MEESREYKEGKELTALKASRGSRGCGVSEVRNLQCSDGEQKTQEMLMGMWLEVGEQLGCADLVVYV